jgi:hypothetical protein
LIAVAVLAGSWIMMLVLDPKAPPSPHMAGVALLGILSIWRFFLIRTLAQELVRPVARGELLQQVGLVLLVDLFVFWFTVAALSVAAWALFSPAVLVNSHAWYELGMAFCGIPLVVGLAGLALRVRSDLGFWTASMLVYMASMMVVVMTIESRPSLSATPWLCAGLLVAGVCACYVAYRAWLAADLD